MKRGAVLGFLALAAAARAGNLERFSLGDDASMQSGAVAATTREPGAIYYNPAGLALLDRDSVDLGVSAYAARYYRIPKLVHVQLPDGQDDMAFEGTSFFSTPAAVAFGYRLAPGLGASLAIFTRDQLDLLGVFSHVYRGDDAGTPYQYEQGVELDFRAKDYLGGAGLGWAPGDGLRLGLSVLGEYARQSIMTRFWSDYIDLSSFGGGGFYTNRITSSLGQRVGFGAYGLRSILGVQWDLGRGFSLALVGRSPFFVGYTDVEYDIQLAGSNALYGVVVQNHVSAGGVEHPYVWMDPWRAHAALAWRGERLSISLEGDASDRPDDEGRGTVWNWKAGLGWKLNPAWDLGLGAYSDRNWGEAIRNFGDTSMDYYGGSAGLRWRRDIAPTVELSTTLSCHYERGTGDVIGTSFDAKTITFPLPALKTNAVFEEANVHLASGLRW